MSSAYLLVSHGSRDPRPQLAMEQLVKLIYQRFTGRTSFPTGASPNLLTETASQVHARNSDSHTLKHSSSTAFPTGLVPWVQEPIVGIACLELSAEPLHEQIRKFGEVAGFNRIQVVPLFLLPGVHVSEDIPAEVAIAQQVGQVKIDLRPYLGTHPDLSRLLANSMSAITADAWILLAHGSRRPGSKQTVEALATQLGAVSAYWAVPPKLESQVKALVSAGYQQIGILPYFLFAGGITDAIASAVEQLKIQLPAAKLHLAEPIGASAELADLIWDLIER